jgi:hypothetical protein
MSPLLQAAQKLLVERIFKPSPNRVDACGIQVDSGSRLGNKRIFRSAPGRLNNGSLGKVHRIGGAFVQGALPTAAS